MQGLGGVMRKVTDVPEVEGRSEGGEEGEEEVEEEGGYGIGASDGGGGNGVVILATLG